MQIHTPRRNGTHSSFQWHTWHFDGFDTVKEIRQNDILFDTERDGDGNPFYIYRPQFNEKNWVPGKNSFDSWVSLEKGNSDHLTGKDIGFERFDVKEELKYWGDFQTKELDLAGYRIDAVKHINADYIREWVGHLRATQRNNLFAAAEYIASDTRPPHNYI